MKKIDQVNFSELIAHFEYADPIIHEVIQKTGPYEIQLHENHFKSLVEAILSQQVSTKSADAVISRVYEFMGQYHDPEPWTKPGAEEWRKFGVSRQKAGYLNSLSVFFMDNLEELEKIDSKSDEEIIKLLTQIKGIGEWTAHMFLMFSLGRPNVLAHGDLGIQNMVKQVYELKDLPKKEELEMLSKGWSPYKSVVQFYLWEYSRYKP